MAMFFSTVIRGFSTAHQAVIRYPLTFSFYQHPIPLLPQALIDIPRPHSLITVSELSQKRRFHFF